MLIHQLASDKYQNCIPISLTIWVEPYPASKLPTFGPVCPKTPLSADIYTNSCAFRHVSTPHHQLNFMLHHYAETRQPQTPELSIRTAIIEEVKWPPSHSYSECHRYVTHHMQDVPASNCISSDHCHHRLGKSSHLHLNFTTHSIKCSPYQAKPEIADGNAQVIGSVSTCKSRTFSLGTPSSPTYPPDPLTPWSPPLQNAIVPAPSGTNQFLATKLSNREDQQVLCTFKTSSFYSIPSSTM